MMGIGSMVAPAATGGGVDTVTGRPMVDTGQNQHTIYTRSRGDVDTGTFKIRFNGGSLVDAETAAIDLPTPPLPLPTTTAGASPPPAGSGKRIGSRRASRRAAA